MSAIQQSDQKLTWGDHLSNLWESLQTDLTKVAAPVLFLSFIITSSMMTPGAFSVEKVVIIVVQIFLDFAGAGLVLRGITKGNTFFILFGGLLILLTIISALSGVVAFLAPQFTTQLEYLNNGVLIVRTIVSILYGVIMHYVKHVEREARDLQEQHQQHAIQVVQANDHLALQNKKQVEDLANCVHKLVDRIEQVYTEQAVFVDGVHNSFADVHKLVDGVHNAVHTELQSVDMDVYTKRMERLESIVYGLKTSVTEVHQNILQINQSSISHPAEQPKSAPIASSPAKSTPRPAAIPEKASKSSNRELGSSNNIDTGKDLSLPPLEVPGVASAKIEQVVTLFLSGTGWRDMPGNYSRTIKPIRDAYEQYQSQNENIVDSVDPRTQTTVHTPDAVYNV